MLFEGICTQQEYFAEKSNGPWRKINSDVLVIRVKKLKNQVPLQLALYNEPNCNLIQEPVISIQSHFNRSRFIKAVKLQRSFDRFQYSLCVYKKNSLGKYSLFFESSTLNYSQLH